MVAALFLAAGCSDTARDQRDAGPGGPAGIGGAAGDAGGGAAGIGDRPVCGNGVKETCQQPGTIGSCPYDAVSEACDGSDLGGETCQSQGYGSGTLACSAFCELAVSGCSECTTDPAVVGCGLPAFAVSGMRALAATETEVAFVDWPEGQGRKQVVRLSPELALKGLTEIVDENLRQVIPMLAALPSGWLVAWYFDPELIVHTLDANGNDLGRTVIARVSGSNLKMGPALVPRADGGPLFVWIQGGRPQVIVAAPDGRSASPELTLPVSGGPSAQVKLGSRTFAGGAFYLATTVYPDPSDASSGYGQLIRVAADGTSATALDGVPASVANATLITVDGELRSIYDGMLPGDPESHTLMQRLGPDGKALSPPIRLGDDRLGKAWGFLPFGSDVVNVVTGLSVSSLGVVRSGPDGQLVGALHPVIKRPGSAFVSAQVVRRGPDLMMAWFPPTGEGVTLARVRP